MSFSFVEVSGTPRDLYPCLRDGCGCAGVFYKDFGGSSSCLRLTVSLDVSRVDPARESEVRSQFRSATPLVDFVYTCSSPGQTESEIRDATVMSSHWEDAVEEGPAGSASVVGGGGSCGSTASSDVPSTGRWVLLIRPKYITNQGLAQIRIALGPNMLWSDPLEVRTKPSEWIVLQNFPDSWTEESVSAFIKRYQTPTAGPARAVIIRKSIGTESRHALIRMKDRTEVSGIWQRFRSRKSHRDGPEASIVLSLAGSISRQFKEDPTLTFLPSPSAPGKHSSVTYLQARVRVVEAPAKQPATDLVLPIALPDSAEIHDPEYRGWPSCGDSESKSGGSLPCLPVALPADASPLPPAPLGPLLTRRRKRRFDECSESTVSSEECSSVSSSSCGTESPVVSFSKPGVVLPVDYSSSAHADVRRAVSRPGVEGPIALPVCPAKEFPVAIAGPVDDSAATRAELEMIHANPEDMRWLFDDSAALDLESAGSPSAALMDFQTFDALEAQKALLSDPLDPLCPADGSEIPMDHIDVGGRGDPSSDWDAALAGVAFELL